MKAKDLTSFAFFIFPHLEILTDKSRRPILAAMETELTEHLVFSDIPGLAQALDAMVEGRSQLFLLTDSKVAACVLPALIAESESVRRAHIIEVESGEGSKCIEIAHHIWSQLAESHASRNDLLINLGGGMITDLGGFIGSTYKRGMAFMHIPTSLMAMTDAAIGGKTGIDHDSIKNLIGTYAPASQVLICPQFLQTLPLNELYSGFAEMLKHALVADQDLWYQLTELGAITPSTIQPFIKQSLEIKKRICQADPLENGSRKLLNFGHTFGHAVESVFLDVKNPIPHGYAVAIGMMTETYLSLDISGLSVDQRNHILNTMNRIFSVLPLEKLPDFNDLVKYLRNDKKNSLSESLNFTLLAHIGNGVYDQHVSLEQAENAWQQMLIA